MKLSKEQIELIRKLDLEGKKQVEIAKELGCSQSIVNYWLKSQDERKELINNQVNYFRNLPLTKRQEIYKRRLNYIKNYLRNKYQTNEVFRNKELARGRKHERSN